MNVTRWLAIVLLVVVGACAPPRGAAAPGPLERVDVSLDWRNTPPGTERAAAALTATDGTGLRLAAVDARAVLYGPLAFTELHLTFANPEARVREGTFAIALPSDASVSRFAMRVGSAWQEAEVVEKQAARTAYEVGGDFAIVRLESDAATAEEPVRDVAVLIDSSVSRAATYADDVERAARIVDELGVRPIAVAAFDQEIAMYRSTRDAANRRPAGATDLDGALAWAEARGAKRAIVLTDGLPTVGPVERGRLDRVDVLADVDAPLIPGVGATAEHGEGPVTGPHLRELAAAGRQAGAVISLRAAPADAARAIASPAHGIVSATVPGAAQMWPRGIDAFGASGSSALAFVELGAGTPLRAGVNGAYPRPVGPVENAPAPIVERAVVEVHIADLEQDRAAVDGRVRKAEGNAPASTLRALVRAREEIDAEIVALSTRHRILTARTAMLVLDSDADFARLGVPRTATSHVPVVGPAGVEIRKRADRPNVGTAPRTSSRDADGDGIADELDTCPNEPETVNGYEDDDGCPDRGSVRIDSMTVRIIPRIYFRLGSFSLAPDALPPIDDIAEVLQHQPDFLVVAVFGHADRSEANAQLLSTRRADAVYEALLQRGVDPKRLVAKGLAARFPIDEANTAEARARNRRVEFRIVVTTNGPTGVELSDEVAETFRHGKVAPRHEPYGGDFSEVMTRLTKSDAADAVAYAEAWVRRAPGDVLAWIALGRALEAIGNAPEAARAYGSLVDLAVDAAQLRAAGGFLESIAPKHARALDVAIEAYRRAFAERPDQLASHRLLAWALAQKGHVANALQLLEAGMTHFAAKLQRDVDLLSGKGPAAAILTWESDTDDLDLVAFDEKGKATDAITDVRDGFGPEVIALDPRPARLEVHYVARGRSGFPLGKVMVVTPGKTPLIESRPFVIMNPYSRVVP